MKPPDCGIEIPPPFPQMREKGRQKHAVPDNTAAPPPEMSTNCVDHVEHRQIHGDKGTAKYYGQNNND